MHQVGTAAAATTTTTTILLVVVVVVVVVVQLLLLLMSLKFQLIWGIFNIFLLFFSQVKVKKDKFTLEQAMKAQMGNRGRALLFL